MTASGIPYNDEAEKRILNILISPGANSAAYMDRLIAEEKVTPDDFFGTDNKRVLLAIKRLCDDEKPVDIATVANALNCASSERGMRVLKNIASMETLRTAFSYYAKLVKELSERRKYIAMAQKIIALASDTSQPFDGVTYEVEQAIKRDDESGVVCLKSVMAEVYTDIVDKWGAPENLSGLPTEWKSINKLTGGLGRGELVIVGGRPGMGKSIVGQNLASYTANISNKKVIFFSLEMTKKQLGARLLSAATGTQYKKYRNGTVDGDDFYKMGVAMDELNLENILVDDTPRTDIEHIKAACRAAKRKYKDIGVVIIDYIGLIQLPKQSRTRWEGIGEITRELKLLAKELDCPVVALSQINREVEKERDKRPKLSDLRDSGCVEQDADIILLLYRDEYYNPNTKDKGVVEMAVAKCRDGSPGMAKLSWQPQVMRIMEFSEVKRVKKQNEKFKIQKYGEQKNLLKEESSKQIINEEDEEHDKDDIDRA